MGKNQISYKLVLYILGQQESNDNLQALHTDPIAPILFVTLSKI